jgi:ribosome-associated translation inhibitor RaiA
MIELGGNIQLVGFKDFDSSELVVMKKIIGNYARKFSDNLENYEKLTVSLKQIGPKSSNKYEIQIKLMVKGKPTNTDVTENNVYFALAQSFKKLENQVLK